MSCRVIGRGVEFSFWRHVVADAHARGCRVLQAEYRPTLKNAQVADFYERLGLPVLSQDKDVKRYRIALDNFNPKPIDWIEVTP